MRSRTSTGMSPLWAVRRTRRRAAPECVPAHAVQTLSPGFEPLGSPQARVRCPAGRSSRGCPPGEMSVALFWRAAWPDAVAGCGSKRVLLSSK